MLHFSNQKLEELVSHTFSIECSKIELTQQDTKKPLVFSGPGSISLNNDGTFSFKFYNTAHEKNHIFDLHKTQSNYDSGEIMGEDCFFSLEAVDFSGYTWTSKNIHITPDVFNTHILLIEGKINKMQNVKKRHEKSDLQTSSIFILIPGKFSIPCNTREELPNKGWILNTCNLNINDIEISLQDKKTYMIVKAEGHVDKLGSKFKQRLLEALNIVFGRLCLDILTITRHKGETINCLSGHDSSVPNKKLAEPILHSLPNQDKPLKEFLTKYLSTFSEPSHSFYGFWHKINRAHQSNLDIMALVVSTSIEGIVKEYFNKDGLPEDELLTDAQKALDKIKNIDLPANMKDRIQSSLAGVKRPTTKRSLQSLSKKTLFDKRLISTWSEIRNKSAHADKIDITPQQLQKYLNEIYGCLHIFYTLLLYKIDYEEHYTDYSKIGWAETKLKDFEP